MATSKKYLFKKRLGLFYEIKMNLDFIKGSITKVIRKNKNTGEFYHLTYKDNKQKTQTKYISAELIKKARSRIQKMNKIKKIINEISKINIEILSQD